MFALCWGNGRTDKRLLVLYDRYPCAVRQLLSLPIVHTDDAQHHLYHLATCDANVRFRFVR